MRQIAFFLLEDTVLFLIPVTTLIRAIMGCSGIQFCFGICPRDCRYSWLKRFPKLFEIDPLLNFFEEMTFFLSDFVLESGIGYCFFSKAKALLN